MPLTALLKSSYDITRNPSSKAGRRYWKLREGRLGIFACHIVDNLGEKSFGLTGPGRSRAIIRWPGHFDVHGNIFPRGAENGLTLKPSGEGTFSQNVSTDGVWGPICG